MKTNDYGHSTEIELLSEQESARTLAHMDKAFLLFRHLDRINRISCMNPIDYNLYNNSVIQLELLLRPDVEENFKYGKRKKELEEGLEKAFNKISKKKKEQVYHIYMFEFYKGVFALLNVLMCDRGYFDRDYV